MIYRQNKSSALVDATEAHVKAMRNNLRQADKDEVWSSHMLEGWEALTESFKKSTECYTILHRDEPVAMFGVKRVTLLAGGRPWLLATDGIADVGLAFPRYSRGVVDGWVKKYGFLDNYVDARNTLAIKWLEWCGFIIAPAEPAGALGYPFHYFYKGG